MSNYLAKVINDVIAFNHYQGQAHFLSQGLHCLQAVLMLGIGVDIGIIPESTDGVPLLSPVFDGIGSAVGAAAMDQNCITLHRRYYFATGWVGLVFPYCRASPGAGKLAGWLTCLSGCAPESPVEVDMAHRHP